MACYTAAIRNRMREIRLMGNAAGEKRVFLFLQGPHGPFFHRLGRMLRLTGAQVWRVGFNAGDRAFWFHPKSFIPCLLYTSPSPRDS